MIVNHRFHRMQIVKRHMDNVRGFRAETVGIFRLPADRNGKQRTAMKSVMKSDDFRFVRAVAGGRIVARQFKRGLVGFGPGVHKQYALGERGVDDFTAQT